MQKYSKKFNYWIPIVIIIFTGIFIRWNNNFSNTLISGINGGYYAFQVKSLFENYRLGFSDMPFVFYLEALIAKIISFFSPADFKSTIILASKITDSIIPPILAVPLFLLSKAALQDLRWSKLIAVYVLCAFSVLYLTFIVILASDFHKNAIGLIFIAFSLYFMYKYSLLKNRRDFIWATLFFGLCLLTHVGCFGALLVFIITFLFMKVIQKKGNFKKYKNKLIIGILFFIVIVALLAVIDRTRFARFITFISSPLTFFENPVILFLVDGQPVIRGLVLVNFIVLNLLSITGTIYLFIRRKRFDPNERIFVLGIAFTALFLSSPLIGLEWSERFMNISAVFIVVEFIFIYKVLTNRIIRIAGLSFFVLTMVYSSRPAMLGKRSHITETAYQELKKIKQHVKFKDKTILITRHGLEWWSGFLLDTKIGQDFSLTKSEFDNYDDVYVLVQLRGNNFERIAWSHFLEVEVPQTAIKVFSGTHFELFRLTEPLNFTKEISSPPLMYGEIIEIKENDLLVANEFYRYKVRLNENTRVAFKLDANSLKKGMFIEVWGERMPFSLRVKGETIHQIDQLKTFNEL
jgi:hypothetical protein